jgi:Tol biopolymer transport system component
MEERQFYLHSVPSPTGDKIAVTIRKQGLDNIWVYGFEEEAFTPVTFDGRNTSPVWDHAGNRLVFNSNRTGTYNLFIKPIDGSESVRQLTRSDNFQIPYSISSTGLLTFAERNPKTKHDIWVLDLAEGSEPQPFLQTPANERQAMFSPDGRWIAYESDQSRRNEVYVRPYPGPGPTVQVSTRGGQYPIWHPNGRELFYLSKRRLMSVKISAGTELRASTAETLFSEDIWNGCYAVSPDGNRFLIVQRTEEAAVQQVNLVLNWFEELKRLVENR